MIPRVRAGEVPGRSQRAKPVRFTLKPGVGLVRQKQYPLKIKSGKELLPLVETLIKYGPLKECEYKLNTPILLVKKANGKVYQLVQDLRAINETEDVHSVVANPCTLLTTFNEKQKCFTVLDPKDASFCIPLSTESQELFAFEWENPNIGRRTQLAWTALPEGFKNSTNVFRINWKTNWRNGNIRTLLESCSSMEMTFGEPLKLRCNAALLSFLGLSGYRASTDKAQIFQTMVTCLGLDKGGWDRNERNQFTNSHSHER